MAAKARMIPEQRRLLATYMDLLVRRRDKVGYRQLRPMATHAIDNWGRLFGLLEHGFAVDCSESIVLAYHMAGLKSPCGPTLGYGGYGNTQSFLKLPRFEDAADAETGTIVVFNADRPLDQQHAAMVRTPGKDPRLFTQGNPTDPRFLRLSQLQPGFPGKTVFCAVHNL